MATTPVFPSTHGDVPPGPMPDPPVHREQLTSGLPHGQIFTHGHELRFQLHLWRRFRIFPPPVAMFRRRPSPDPPDHREQLSLGPPPARPSPQVRRARSRLRLWRRFGALPPPGGRARRRPTPDPPDHREQLSLRPPPGQIFTHGHELRFQLHLWRRFRIFPPPVAMFRRRPSPDPPDHREQLSLGPRTARSSP